MTGMLSIYWGTFLFGGILIGASIFMGDGDGDGDGDFDKDVSIDKDVSLDFDGDGDADFDSMAWLPFLSLRFWTFFFGLFGLSGILLTGLGTGATLTLATSSVFGVGMAYPISYLFQKLKSDSVTSLTDSRDYTQEIATAILPIRANGQGKIRITTSGELVDLIANNPTYTDIEQGSEVLVISVDEGIATVSPLPKERLTDTTS